VVDENVWEITLCVYIIYTSMYNIRKRLILNWLWYNLSITLLNGSTSVFNNRFDYSVKCQLYGVENIISENILRL